MKRSTRGLMATAIAFSFCLGLATVGEADPFAPAPQKTAKKTTKGKKGATKPADTPAPKTEPAPAAAEEEGALKFSRDIAPILVANCTNCHNQQHRSGLNQTTFDGLLKGGKTGKAIVPGKPEESLLLARVKGEEGAKMPPGQRDLSQAAIEKIEAWIKSGARLDAGLNSGAALTSYALTPEERRKQELAKMSVADRDKQTESVGLERLKKATESFKPEVQKGTNFMLFSNLPKERATALLKAMDAQVPTLRRLLTGDKPALNSPEKYSLYVFKDRTGYTEFVRSIENQEVDETETFRSKLTVESPYILAIDPLGYGPEAASSGTTKRGSRSRKKAQAEDATGPERTLTGLVTEAFTNGVAAQAGAPLWVSSGLGAYLGSQLEPRSRYYGSLRATAYDQCRLGWPSKATEALGGQGKLETTRAVGFALFEWIGRNASPIAFSTFVQGMTGGQARLDDSIQKGFGLTREQFLDGSGEWVYASYGRGR